VRRIPPQYSPEKHLLVTPRNEVTRGLLLISRRWTDPPQPIEGVRSIPLNQSRRWTDPTQPIEEVRRSPSRLPRKRLYAFGEKLERGRSPLSNKGDVSLRST